MSQANVDLMRRAIEALRARDLDIDELFDDSVEWRPVLTAGGGVEGTVYRGRGGMKDYIKDFDDGFEEMVLDITEIESVGQDRVLYRGRLKGRGTASGVQLDVPTWGLWEAKDGKLIRGEGFLSEDEALRAAGLRA